MCVYMCSIYSILHISYYIWYIEKTTTLCNEELWSETFQAVYDMNIKRNGYSCGNYKRLWDKHSWERQTLKGKIIPASWVKNEINTRKHKYI